MPRRNVLRTLGACGVLIGSAASHAGSAGGDACMPLDVVNMLKRRGGQQYAGTRASPPPLDPEKI